MTVTRSRTAAIDLELSSTFRLHRLGRHDPTASASATHFEKRHVDRRGRVVRHRVERVDDGVLITVHVDDQAGPVTDDDADALLLDPEGDPGAATFAAMSSRHPLVRELHRRQVGMRLLPVPWTFDVVAAVVLQQRVAFKDAARAFGQIARRHGTWTPDGPCFPSPAQVLAMSVDDFMATDVDPKRARALRAVAFEMERSSLLAPLRPGADRATVFSRDRARLTRLPGIGPWTIGMTMGFARGDTDAVVVGDLHLPHLVVASLGEGRGPPTDERMLELLAPFADERFRVTRLLWQGGLGKRG